MSDVAERVTAWVQGWFTKMCLQYCGRDYGSETRNQYFFYRRVYEMTAEQAWAEVHKSNRLFNR